MTTTTASVPTLSPSPDHREVSRLRLYVLRGPYLLLVIGLRGMILRLLIGHWPLARWVTPIMRGTFWLPAVLGGRFPLQLIPLLPFFLYLCSVCLAGACLWCVRPRVVPHVCSSLVRRNRNCEASAIRNSHVCSSSSRTLSAHSVARNSIRRGDRKQDPIRGGPSGDSSSKTRPHHDR